MGTRLSIALPLEYLHLENLKRSITVAKTEVDFFHILDFFEHDSPLFYASDGIFGLMPTTLRHPSDWPSLLGSLKLPKQTVAHLLSSGFMPFDKQHVIKRTTQDVVRAIKHDGDHTLIDADYGVLLRNVDGVIGNFGFDRAMIDRYSEFHPIYRQRPHLVFSIGAMRGQQVFLGEDQGHDSPVEVHVTSRRELDQVLERLRRGLSNWPVFELWFRGQTQEYLLPDALELANANVCPWRNIRDCSLVPSVYRSIEERLRDLREYCHFLRDLHLFVLFMRSKTRTWTGEKRLASSPPSNPLPRGWQDYKFTLSMEYTDDTGDRIAEDYSSGFSGLQQSFFLQHYGLPSNILDVTGDVNVALFFAQNILDPNVRFQRVRDAQTRPVVYCFILDRNLDRFLPSRHLMMGNDLRRPLNQRCGILCGASFVTRNYYSRFVAIKIFLDGFIPYDDVKQDYLFPDSHDDSFLRDLVEFSQEEQCALKPFVLGKNSTMAVPDKCVVRGKQ